MEKKKSEQDCKILSMATDKKRMQIVIKWQVGEQVGTTRIDIGQPQQLTEFRHHFQKLIEEYLASKEQ